MKFPRGPLPRHPALCGTLLCAIGLAASAANAATVNVRVLDATGRPLPQAVVMLEPVAAKMSVAPLAGVEVSQAKRQFNPPVTVVTVGTRVTFPNFDTVRHHVYSFSPAKRFELKLYAGTPASPVLFDKPGVVVIGCNIHDNMAAWVVVVDTPLYAVSATSGRVHIPSVPAGAYRLRVWHAGLAVGQEIAATAVEVATGDLDEEVRLAVQGSEP